jgi:putative transposase
LKITRENGWGYTRVLGELKKLGIRTVTRSTVQNILREAGLEPGPKRGEGTWTEFVQRHTATLWAADFLAVRTLTASGFVDLFVVFLIRIGNHLVIVSAPSANPDSAWVTQQARNAAMQMGEWGLSGSRLLIDHDTKFTDSFAGAFKTQGAEVQRVGPRAPNMNAYAKRFAQTLRTECLDHFLICGERHLHHLVIQLVTHYLDERPHQGVGNVPLPDAGQEDDEPRLLPSPSGEVPPAARQALEALLPGRGLSHIGATTTP